MSAAPPFITSPSFTIVDKDIDCSSQEFRGCTLAWGGGRYALAKQTQSLNGTSSSST